MADRQGRVSWKDAPSEVALVRLSATERLSELYTVRVDIVLPSGEEIEFLSYLGTPVSVSIAVAEDHDRYFQGLMFSAEYLHNDGQGSHYRLVLRPKLALLTLKQDTRIFQTKDALDIIHTVLSEHGVSAVQVKAASLRGSRDYCVQSRETDFAFISRLMEEEGIYYYFDHGAEQETLVLCDGPSSHAESKKAAVLPFNPEALEYGSERGALWMWREAVRATSRKVSLQDWDYLKPGDLASSSEIAKDSEDKFGTQRGTNLDARADRFRNPSFRDAERAENVHSALDQIGGTLEVYDYPGQYWKKDVGAHLAKAHLEVLRAQMRSLYGEGGVPAMELGRTFSLAQHPEGRFNTDYLVIGLDYSASIETYASGVGGGHRHPVQIVIQAIPAKTPWRPLATTPRPTARGPQTALVVGPSGEKIYTDDHGRVKVQFHWDRRGKHDEHSSCWLRVSEGSAGDGFGHFALPRIGQEVIVDFLDGDPDRPIITGRVYNSDRMPPLTPGTSHKTEEKTKSYWRGRTVGSDQAVSSDSLDDFSGYPIPNNEIVFEDKAGKEMISVYAPGDMKRGVQRDDKERVGRDQNVKIGRHQTSEVKKNLSMTVVEGNHDHTVKQGNVKVDVSQGDMTTDVAMGNYSVKTDLGSVKIEAMQKIELIVGQSKITLDQTGIKLEAMMISSEATIQYKAKGLMTEIDGDVMLTAKGAIVMIN